MKPILIPLTLATAKIDQNTAFILSMQVTGQHPLTGTVSIYDYANGLLGPFTLTNGQAQTTAQFGGILGVGVHQLTATYIGDSQNLPSTSAPVSQAVTGTFSIQVQGWTGADGHFLNATIGIQWWRVRSLAAAPRLTLEAPRSLAFPRTRALLFRNL